MHDMTTILQDIYYAARQPNGIIINGVGALQKPNTIPVIVLRYLLNQHPQTVFIHEDQQKVEINGELHNYTDQESQLPLELATQHTPNDEPNPSQWAIDATTIAIIREIDQDIINDIRRSLNKTRIDFDAWHAEEHWTSIIKTNDDQP